MVLVRLAIDGEAGIGPARLSWESCGELIQTLGNRIEDADLSPIVCAELLADLALNAQRTQEIDRLHKTFRSLVGKSSKLIGSPCFDDIVRLPSLVIKLGAAAVEPNCDAECAT